MAAEPVRLFDSSPNARRYSAADKEAAYQTWKIAAGRSLRKTAEALDIAPSTLSSWSQRDGWIARARQEDKDEAESVRLSVASLVTSETVKSIQTAVEIRDHGEKDKDRLAAAIWLAGVGGVAPLTKSDLLLRNETPRASIADAPSTPPTDDEARALRDFLTRQLLEADDEDPAATPDPNPTPDPDHESDPDATP